VGRVSWPRNIVLYPEPRALGSSKAAAPASQVGREAGARDGVRNRGTQAVDDPETWETLHLRSETSGRPKPGTTVAAAEGEEGVGGLHRSCDVGEEQAPRPDRAKAVRAGVNFWRATCAMQRHRTACPRDFRR